MLEHPPIPPNCERVEQALKDKYAPLLKDIIAALARCAWLDEAERLARDSQHAPIKEGRIYPNLTGISHDNMGRRIAAMNNAEAWAKWGRGEKWS